MPRNIGLAGSTRPDGRQVSEPPDDGNFLCPFAAAASEHGGGATSESCANSVFKDMAKLNEHISRVHSRKYLCSKCEKYVFPIVSRKHLKSLQEQHKTDCQSNSQVAVRRSSKRVVRMTCDQEKRWKDWRKQKVPLVQGERRPEKSWRMIYHALFPRNHFPRMRNNPRPAQDQPTSTGTVISNTPGQEVTSLGLSGMTSSSATDWTLQSRSQEVPPVLVLSGIDNTRVTEPISENFWNDPFTSSQATETVTNHAYGSGVGELLHSDDAGSWISQQPGLYSAAQAGCAPGYLSHRSEGQPPSMDYTSDTPSNAQLGPQTPYRNAFRSYHQSPHLSGHGGVDDRVMSSSLGDVPYGTYDTAMQDWNTEFPGEDRLPEKSAQEQDLSGVGEGLPVDGDDEFGLGLPDQTDEYQAPNEEGYM